MRVRIDVNIGGDQYSVDLEPDAWEPSRPMDDLLDEAVARIKRAYKNEEK